MNSVEIVWYMVIVLNVATVVICSYFFGIEDIGVIVIMIIVLCSINVVGVGNHYDAYSRAIKMPNEYIAIVKNVEETEEHLMDATSIGQGLEALEYKKKLQQCIEEKNTTYAGIVSYLEDYYSPYKELVKDRLPKGTYGTIEVK